MRFPSWFKTESRESNFTNLVVGHLLASAEGPSADTGSLGVLEIASGIYGRAFAAADVSPTSFRSRHLDPATLSLIARELIRSGDIVFVPVIDRRGIRLVPASDWDITGGADPESWSYRVSLAGPSTLLTRILPASGVLHFMYAQNPIQPWRGLSPLMRARSTGAIAANLELRLSQEMSGRSGNLLPVPGDPSEPRYDGLRADLGNLRGDTAMVPSLAGGFEMGPSGQGRQDWKPVRFGANPPESIDKIRTTTGRQILAACGVPIPLAEGGAQSAGLREGFRQFLHLSVTPLARLIVSEISRKLELPGMTLTFRRLHAADLMGRARAYQSLVGAGAEGQGMDPERASRIAGLED